MSTGEFSPLAPRSEPQEITGEISSRTEDVSVSRAEPPDGTIPAKHGGWLKPWQPGQSGNPLGNPSNAYFTARKICSDASPEAARKQVELMHDEDGRVALMATEAVLNRGAGKPRDHSSEDRATSADLSALSPDERRTLAQLLARALGVKGV